MNNKQKHTHPPPLIREVVRPAIADAGLIHRLAGAPQLRALCLDVDWDAPSALALIDRCILWRVEEVDWFLRRGTTDVKSLLERAPALKQLNLRIIEATETDVRRLADTLRDAAIYGVRHLDLRVKNTDGPRSSDILVAALIGCPQIESLTLGLWWPSGREAASAAALAECGFCPNLRHLWVTERHPSNTPAYPMIEADIPPAFRYTELSF